MSPGWDGGGDLFKHPRPRATLEFEPYPSPSADGSAGCEKRGGTNRIIAPARKEWTPDEIAVVVERRRAQLRRVVVAVVEQVVDLEIKLYSLRHLVMRPQIHHAVAGGIPWPKII